MFKADSRCCEYLIDPDIEVINKETKMAYAIYNCIYSKRSDISSRHDLDYIQIYCSHSKFNMIYFLYGTFTVDHELDLV
jgi:hypothetical protein